MNKRIDVIRYCPQLLSSTLILIGSTKPTILSSALVLCYIQSLQYRADYEGCHGSRKFSDGRFDHAIFSRE